MAPKKQGNHTSTGASVTGDYRKRQTKQSSALSSHTHTPKVRKTILPTVASKLLQKEGRASCSAVNGVPLGKILASNFLPQPIVTGLYGLKVGGGLTLSIAFLRPLSNSSVTDRQFDPRCSLNRKLETRQYALRSRILSLPCTLLLQEAELHQQISRLL